MFFQSLCSLNINSNAMLIKQFDTVASRCFISWRRVPWRFDWIYPVIINLYRWRSYIPFFHFLEKRPNICICGARSARFQANHTLVVTLCSLGDFLMRGYIIGVASILSRVFELGKQEICIVLRSCRVALMTTLKWMQWLHWLLLEWHWLLLGNYNLFIEVHFLNFHRTLIVVPVDHLIFHSLK